MPTYLYKCSSGHDFELEQRITDPPMKKCLRPQCSSDAARQIGNVGFILKGFCWGYDLYTETDTRQQARHDAKSKPFLYRETDE